MGLTTKKAIYISNLGCIETHQVTNKIYIFHKNIDPYFLTYKWWLSKKLKIFADIKLKSISVKEVWRCCWKLCASWLSDLSQNWVLLPDASGKQNKIVRIYWTSLEQLGYLGFGWFRRSIFERLVKRFCIGTLDAWRTDCWKAKVGFARGDKVVSISASDGHNFSQWDLWAGKEGSTFSLF